MTPGGDGPNMSHMTSTRTVLLILGLGLAACKREATPEATVPLMAFDSARARLVTATDTVALSIEVARTKEQQTIGLMERPHLADSAGMLFVYDTVQPPTAAFWMFRTLIPLDIAFADSAGIIRSIVHMVPCQAATAGACPNYPPGVAYRSALEVNAGYFARNAIKIGDRLVTTGRP